MVWIRHGKVWLEAVGILILCNYCWESDWKLFVKHAWCSMSVFFRDGKFLLEAVGILSLFKYSSAHLVHCRLSSRWKIVAWGRCNFELVQTMWGTHGVHHLFSCMSENSLLGQVELRACAIFTHAWSPQCVFFRDGKFLLEAGGILSLCNYSWKLDWRLFCNRKFVLEAVGILSWC